MTSGVVFVDVCRVQNQTPIPETRFLWIGERYYIFAQMRVTPL